MQLSVIAAIVLMNLPMCVCAQMLGDLKEYPQLTISMHYWALDSADGEGFSISWLDNGAGIKVKSTVAPSLKTRQKSAKGNPVKDVLYGDLPDSAVGQIFEEARALTTAFRFIPEKNGGGFPKTDSIELIVSSPNYDEKVDLKFTRADPTVWSAAAKFWTHLRVLLSAQSKEVLHEIP